MSSSAAEWKQPQVGRAGDRDTAGEQRTCPCLPGIYIKEHHILGAWKVIKAFSTPAAKNQALKSPSAKFRTRTEKWSHFPPAARMLRDTASPAQPARKASYLDNHLEGEDAGEDVVEIPQDLQRQGMGALQLLPSKWAHWCPPRLCYHPALGRGSPGSGSVRLPQTQPVP